MGIEPIVSLASRTTIAALLHSSFRPALARGQMRNVGGCPYSYRSFGDYCIPSKNSKDAFIRTGNS